MILDPKIISFDSGGKKWDFSSHKRALVLGFLTTFVLVVGLGIGTFLVTRPKSQSIGSKAAGCIMLWPAKPGTTCANSKLSPAMNATNVSLTPDFIWDYGGYRDGDSGVCVQPSGCAGYYANVSVYEGSSATGTRVMGCGAVQDSNGNPPKACNWVSFYAGPLKPNTKYTWRVEPGTSGGSHAGHDWNYTFTTGAGSVPPKCNESCNSTVNPPVSCPLSLVCQTPASSALGSPGLCRNPQCVDRTDCVCPTPIAACQKVTPSKELNTLKIGDTVTFTGFGTLTNPVASDSIDKINFIILKDGQEASNTEAATTLDDTGAWKATQDYKIENGGSYSVRIRVHWKSKDVWLE